MTEMTNLAFGELLRRCRRAAGLTQEELASRAGLSARGIADLERGVRRSPRRDTVTLLLQALGSSPEDAQDLLAAAQRSRAPVVWPDQVPIPAMEPASDGSVWPVVQGQTSHNLPVQPTPLLGRADALRAIVALVRRADVRLVTLLGPGGIGKTRLALEVAAELLQDHTDGVWFVRLARLTNSNQVLPKIAETLGLQVTGDQPIADLICAYLRGRRMVLVLDNCEHVVAAAPAIALLLSHSPALSIIATSRMPLRLRGEHEYPVAPLGLPPTDTVPGLVSMPERLTEYPAVALFVERARALRPAFALSPANASAVAAICARLDGVPLAIELAAARTKLLPPATLLAQLEQGLGLLSGGPSDLLDHQQTMRKALAWSEQLLSPQERMLFRRLAVFAGGCTLEAAETVCVAPEGIAALSGDLLDGLDALVDQSLVQPREEAGELRFGMLRIIREYALEQLRASGEAAALQQAHAYAMLALTERAAPALTGQDAGQWLDRLEREHDNLRVALEWARDQHAVETGLRIVGAGLRFWMMRGYLQEGRQWTESLLAIVPASNAADEGAVAQGIRARALFAAGVLAVYQMDNFAAEKRLVAAAALGRAAGDLHTEANALSSLGVMAIQQGDLARAQACLAESLALMRALHEQRGTAVVLTNLGIVLYGQGDLGEAADAFTQALDYARQACDQDLTATNLANLSGVALRQGEIARSEALGREVLALYWQLGDPRRCAVGLEGLASSAGMAGQGERAARLLGVAATLRTKLGAPLPPLEQSDIEQWVAEARDALGANRWAAAYAAGQALTLAEAIDEALGQP